MAARVISDQNDFSYFFIYKSPRYFLSSFKSTGLSLQEKMFKIDFQDGNCGGHIGFPIRTIYTIFDLHVTQILPTSFKWIEILVQEKKFKIDFSR